MTIPNTLKHVKQSKQVGKVQFSLGSIKQSMRSLSDGA